MFRIILCIFSAFDKLGHGSQDWMRTCCPHSVLRRQLPDRGDPAVPRYAVRQLVRVFLVIGRSYRMRTPVHRT